MKIVDRATAQLLRADGATARRGRAEGARREATPAEGDRPPARRGDDAVPRLAGAVATAGGNRPAAGRWSIDPGHADVAFVGRHFMLTKVRGRFRAVEGDIVIGEDLLDSSVDVRIEMASVDSGDETRDQHLRSEELFDVARHPLATFRSTRITADRTAGTDGVAGTMAGDLTIKGVTRPVALEVAFLGAVTDPWGSERVVFSARGRVNREDWGVTWNMVLETGGVLVSKEIDIEIELEAIRQDG